MTSSPPDEEQDELLLGTRLRAERQRCGENEPSVAHRLAQIGVLGWIIVTPMLLGVFAGRWLDGWLSTGIFWTAPLMLGGLGLGCWSAWRWMLLGAAHLGSLRWNTHLLARGGRVSTSLGLMVLRFAVLGAGLALAAWLGTGILLATALGVLVSRAVILRAQLRRMAP